MRYPGPYSYDAAACVWRLNIWQPHSRVQRGKRPLLLRGLVAYYELDEESGTRANANV